MTLHTHKEGPWIIFDIDGRIAKYNLSTHATIGFMGRPVKSLDSQLGRIGISEVINSFDDPIYQAFLRCVQHAIGSRRMIKASTLFRQLAAYGWLEQRDLETLPLQSRYHYQTCRSHWFSLCETETAALYYRTS